MIPKSNHSASLDYSSLALYSNSAPPKFYRLYKPSLKLRIKLSGKGKSTFFSQKLVKFMIKDICALNLVTTFGSLSMIAQSVLEIPFSDQSELNINWSSGLGKYS